jgi:type 1 glutamine amidotransferase
MRTALALALLLAALPACESSSRGESADKPPLRAALKAREPQPAPQPAPVAPAAPAAQPPAVAPVAEAPPADDGPPPLDRAVEPRRSGQLRVLVLSGGGYHEFAGNLSRLLPAVAARVPMTLTELTIDPTAPASATSLRALQDADLPAECDVILDYTQGDLPLSDAVKDKLLAFVRGGGGLVGLHCAADSYPGWAGWDDLLRGRFERHPPFGDIVVAVSDRNHVVVAGLPPEWILKDEFYHLKNCAWDDKTVIMTGTSPEGGELRPVTWVREYGAGRVVYTILGHGRETHDDPRYQQLVAQALCWAARQPVPTAAGGSASPTPQCSPTLELGDVEDFDLTQSQVDGVTELHITGQSTNTGCGIDRVEDQLDGDTLVVLVAQSLAHAGGTGTLDHRLRVPPACKRVVFGTQRAPIWPDTH